MNGYEKLSNVIQRRMIEVNTQGKDLGPCLGTVDASLAIMITEGDKDWPIPKGDYMIASRLKIPSIITTSDSEGHSHTVTTGISPLKSGDRVLVVWVGKEPVVVDVVNGS